MKPNPRLTKSGCKTAYFRRRGEELMEFTDPDSPAYEYLSGIVEECDRVFTKARGGG